jgi:hypothetical protein
LAPEVPDKLALSVRAVMGLTLYLDLLHQLVVVVAVQAILLILTDEMAALAVVKVAADHLLALELQVKDLLVELAVQVVAVVVAQDKLAHLLLAMMLAQAVMVLLLLLLVHQ